MATRNGTVHVATTRRTYKGNVYETHLLRRTYREDGKVKHQTLGNISHLPADLIELIRHRLQSGLPLSLNHSWKILRSLPHGHVAAVLGTLKQLQLDQIIGSKPSAQRDLVVAMIVSRILCPTSKLATTASLRPETANSTLASQLNLQNVREKDLYAALDWLLQRQTRIENKLAKKHLSEGTLLLYDVSSSYYTGRQSSLVDYGYNRDGKRGVPQIVYGLLCNAEGCPIAIEVFAGNTSDPKTFTSQVEKVRKRFQLRRVVFVGDRGMITNTRIDEDLRPSAGLDWITSLRSSQIKSLIQQGAIQRSLFDEQHLAEVHSPDYPEERLIVCRNPALAEERARKREALLAATEAELEQVLRATRRDRRRLQGADRIGIRVGKIINQYKVGKHFVIEITEEGLSYHRDEEKIQQEAMLDGLYVIRTSLASETLDNEATVRAYKDLSKVERAFRSLKTMDLKVRPIYHRLDDRIRSHVFLCMLAYYVEWHLRQRLAPLLFDDQDQAAAQADRESMVSPAIRSETAKQKDANKQTAEGDPVQSFQSLLRDLATLTQNRVRVDENPATDHDVFAEPTSYQRRVLELLGVSIQV